MRVVVDTNVAVSALLFPSSVPGQVFDLAMQRGSVLISLPVLTELSEVLNRKRFRRYVSEDVVRRFVAALARESEWIDIDVQITACRDPKDDKFLSLAVSGHATHIITGDSDLLVLHPFQGIQILQPQLFPEKERQ